MGRLREWNNGLELQSLYSEQALCAVSYHGLPKPTSRLIISHKDRDHVWMDCVLPTSVCTIDHLRPKSRIDCKIAATSSFQHVCARKTLNQSWEIVLRESESLIGCFPRRWLVELWLSDVIPTPAAKEPEKCNTTINLLVARSRFLL